MFGYRETLRKLKENDKIGIYIYKLFLNVDVVVFYHVSANVALKF